MPDDKGGQKNLIIGFDEPSDYLKNPLCAGQSIGRVAGRINQGKVNLDGKEIQLPQNEKETLFTVVQKVSTNTFGKQELKMILTKPLLS